MKILVYILLFVPLFCFSQSTTNLILNNSFETINSGSSLYQSFNHEADLRDSSFQTTAIPCWIGADRGSQGIDYDSLTMRLFPGEPLDGIYPEDQSKTVGLFTGFFSSTTGRRDTTIEIPNALVETRLRAPLIAGTTYYLSGYINSYSDSFIPGCLRCDTLAFELNMYSYIRKLGINFSTTKIYFDNSNYQINLTPTLTFNIPPLAFQILHNPWYKFEITYTAAGGEQYLTMGNFDSTRSNVTIYPALDSIAQHYRPGISLDSFFYETTLYFDNLTLIPLSDTGLLVVNPHITDPDSMLHIHDTVMCRRGASIMIGTDAPFRSYSWSTGDTTRTISVTAPGTYSVTVDNGCALYADTIQVRPDSTLRSGYIIADTSICSYSALTYTLPDSFLTDHILWSSGDTGLTAVFSPGVHTLSLSNQCVRLTDTFSIHYTGADTVHLFADTARTFCAGRGAILSTSGVYESYLWSTQAMTDSIFISHSGYYSLTVTDSSGCSILGGVRYTSLSLPAGLLSQDTISACLSQYPVTITADSGFSQYLWNGIPGSRQYTIDTPNTTVYINGTNQCGTVRDTLVAIAINEHTGLTYSIDSDCTQNVATVSLSAIGHPSILWSTGSTDPQITTTLPRQLIVEAKYLCTALYDTVNIPGCALFTHHLYIPDAFTPNGDGTNDVFEVFGDKVNWKYVSISIYDRWGEKVFESTDLDFKWDGRYKGAVAEGVYVYTLALAYTDGIGKSGKGSITLIK